LKYIGLSTTIPPPLVHCTLQERTWFTGMVIDDLRQERLLE